MHIVHGELRKAPFIKQLESSTMFAIELTEVLKDYKTGEKVYTNYKAMLFAKSQAHIDYYQKSLVEGNFIVVTSDKLKIEVSECGKYTKLFMDNARIEGAGYIKPTQLPQQQAPQQQGGYQQQPNPTYQQAAPQAPQQGGYQQAPQQAQPVDFDDDIPF